jgi:hypothetical protein
MASRSSCKRVNLTMNSIPARLTGSFRILLYRSPNARTKPLQIGFGWEPGPPGNSSNCRITEHVGDLVDTDDVLGASRHRHSVWRLS